MRYRNTIIALGFLIIIIQFLGFPQAMRNILYGVSGVAVVVLAYLSKRHVVTVPVDDTLSARNHS